MSTWNARVKCTVEYNPGKGTTSGKTYKVANNRITYDNGKKSMNEFENLEDLNEKNMAKFIEVKGPGRPKRNV